MKNHLVSLIVISALAVSCGNPYLGKYSGAFEQTGANESTIKVYVDITEGETRAGNVKLAMQHYFRDYFCYSDVAISERTEFKRDTLVAFFTVPADSTSTIEREKVDRHLVYKFAKGKDKYVHICSSDSLALPYGEAALTKAETEEQIASLEFDVKFPIQRAVDDGGYSFVLNGPVKSYSRNDGDESYAFNEKGIITSSRFQGMDSKINIKVNDGSSVVTEHLFSSTNKYYYDAENRLFKTTTAVYSWTMNARYDCRGRFTGFDGRTKNGKWTFKIDIIYDNRGLQTSTSALREYMSEPWITEFISSNDILDNYGNKVSVKVVSRYSTPERCSHTVVYY